MDTRTEALAISRRKALLRQCLKEGGEILLKYYGRIKQVRRKEHPASVVCEADVASEQHIIERIRRKFPEDGIIAEESGMSRGQTDYVWVIDPLDGTSNFVAGLPWFGVQIGVLKGSSAVLAGMGLPVSGDLYEAQAGKGAFKNGRRFRIKPERNPQNVLCAFGFDSTASEARMRHHAKLLLKVAAAVRNTRATNSLMDFCYTLDGSFGACINLNCKIWDVAPISLILPEAGGRFTDLAGRELSFVQDAETCRRSYEILGAGRHVHRQLQKVISEAER
jgi:myo-inositol-1(or 4)-monophosphatase